MLGFKIGFWDYITFAALAVIVFGIVLLSSKADHGCGTAHRRRPSKSTPPAADMAKMTIPPRPTRCSRRRRVSVADTLRRLYFNYWPAS